MSRPSTGSSSIPALPHARNATNERDFKHHKKGLGGQQETATGAPVSSRTRLTTSSALGASANSRQERSGQSASLPLTELDSKLPKTRGISSYLTSKSPPSDDLLNKLNSASLGHCHGILHAAGLRRYSDLTWTTFPELRSMGLNPADQAELTKIIRDLNKKDTAAHHRTKLPGVAVNKSRAGADCLGVFDLPYRRMDFQLAPLDKNKAIFKGRFFNVEQCQQIIRMSESYA